MQPVGSRQTRTHDETHGVSLVCFLNDSEVKASRSSLDNATLSTHATYGFAPLVLCAASPLSCASTRADSGGTSLTLLTSLSVPRHRHARAVPSLLPLRMMSARALKHAAVTSSRWPASGVWLGGAEEEIEEEVVEEGSGSPGRVSGKDQARR